MLRAETEENIADAGLGHRVVRGRAFGDAEAAAPLLPSAAQLVLRTARLVLGVAQVDDAVALVGRRTDLERREGAAQILTTQPWIADSRRVEFTAHGALATVGAIGTPGPKLFGVTAQTVATDVAVTGVTAAELPAIINTITIVGALIIARRC
jgi:hypothetical protein